MKFSILILLFTISAFAQQFQFTGDQPAGKNLWRASMAALAATNAMDIQSSWGKRELNGTLAGNSSQFDSKSALIKLGIVGSVCTLEYLVLHRKPALYRKLAFVNFGDASATGGMAIRNYGIPVR